MHYITQSLACREERPLHGHCHDARRNTVCHAEYTKISTLFLSLIVSSIRPLMMLGLLAVGMYRDMI